MPLVAVCVLAGPTKTLYVGVTADLRRRIYEHRQHLVAGFTARYNVDQLVYYEVFEDPIAAIAREKELKGWRRERKIELIEAANAAWRDLSDEI